jgi:hypothetical protein
MHQVLADYPATSSFYKESRTSFPPLSLIARRRPAYRSLCQERRTRLQPLGFGSVGSKRQKGVWCSCRGAESGRAAVQSFDAVRERCSREGGPRRRGGRSHVDLKGRRSSANGGDGKAQVVGSRKDVYSALVQGHLRLRGSRSKQYVSDRLCMSTGVVYGIGLQANWQ